jgi:hypothetical protein
MKSLESLITGGTVFFTILYFIIRMVVEDGTINALKKYESISKQQNKGENGNS